jgi:hypothetical protein
MRGRILGNSRSSPFITRNVELLCEEESRVDLDDLQKAAAIPTDVLRRHIALSLLDRCLRVCIGCLGASVEEEILFWSVFDQVWYPIRYVLCSRQQGFEYGVMDFGLIELVGGPENYKGRSFRQEGRAAPSFFLTELPTHSLLGQTRIASRAPSLNNPTATFSGNLETHASRLL